MSRKKVTESVEGYMDSMPKHALRVYLDVFNKTWNECSKDHNLRGKASVAEMAHKAAWDEVKKQYENKAADD